MMPHGRTRTGTRRQAAMLRYHAMPFLVVLHYISRKAKPQTLHDNTREFPAKTLHDNTRKFPTRTIHTSWMCHIIIAPDRTEDN